MDLTGLYFPEALRWHEGDLWFSDMFDSRVVQWKPGGDAVTVIDRVSGCPSMPGGLGWLPPAYDPDGRGALLIVDCVDRRILALREGELSVHAELGTHFDFPANDMHVDPDGVAWVGSYGFDPATDSPRTSVLLRVDPSGTVTETTARFIFPNGCERDVAGNLVVAETFADRLSTLSDTRASLVEFAPGAGPDGLSIGPDGTIYVALAFARQLVMVRDGNTEVVYEPGPIDGGPGAGPLACYDCAVEPGGRRIAVALASADEELAERVPTGRIVLLDLPTPR